MNIAIVEDMHVDAEILKAQLLDYASLNHLKLDIDCFASAEELLADYQPLKYTVIFLNIFFLNGMNGPEAAEKLRYADNYTLLVFLTSSKDHMPDAFKVHAYDYIEKPIDSKRLYQMMDDILKQVNIQSESQHLNFISQRKEYSLPYSEIVSLATTANYLEITDCTGTAYRTRMTFSSVCETLTADSRFLLIQSGVLVNMEHIAFIKDKCCILSSGEKLPLSVRREKELQRIWQNYTFNDIRNQSLRR